MRVAMKKRKSGDGDLIVSETADGDQDSVSAGLGLGHHEWGVGGK